MVELGRFRLKGLLGRGSFGTAFLAEHEGSGREAVVKIAHASLLDGPDADRVRSRFAAEREAATQVDHPNVVTLFAAGETSDGLPAVAMEFVPGAPLEDILQQRAGRLPPGFVRDVFAQLGSAIAAVHEAEVTHRDLSPANIIVGDGDDGSVVAKVLDFGAARLGPDLGRVSIVGTPRYMAPEQVVGSAGPPSDVYALGAMLWWALSGAEFQSEIRTLEDLTEARLMGTKPADLRSVAPQVPPAVSSLVSDMLAFDPESRPTAAEFCERWACSELAEPDAPMSRRSETSPPTTHASASQPQRLGTTEALCFDDDPVRLGQLQEYLEHAGCSLRVASLHDPMDTLGTPNVVFVSAGLPGGASVSILHRAAELFPGVTVVAAVRSERERAAMIRAGADFAVRIPVDLPHLAEALEAARGPAAIEAAVTTPYHVGTQRPANTEPPADVETFLGRAPELIADISEALEQRRVAAIVDACNELRRHASALGGLDLARLSVDCAAVAQTGDFTRAEGFGAALEQEYGVLFRLLMSPAALAHRSAHA